MHGAAFRCVKTRLGNIKPVLPADQVAHLLKAEEIIRVDHPAIAGQAGLAEGRNQQDEGCQQRPDRHFPAERLENTG